MMYRRLFVPGASAIFLLASGSLLLASSGGDGGVAELNPFSFGAMQRDLAMWTFVVFAVTCFVLIKYAFGPIAKALDEREQGVADQIASAERANSDAQQLLSQYQEKLAGTDAEVKRMIDAAKAEGHRMAEDILAQARASAEQQQKRALAEIDAAATNAIQELAEKSATLATGLAGRIIRKEIDPGAHRDLVNSAINGLTNN